MTTKRGRFQRMVNFLVSWLNADSVTSFYPRTLPRWKSCLSDYFVIFPWFTLALVLLIKYAS